MRVAQDGVQYPKVEKKTSLGFTKKRPKNPKRQKATLFSNRAANRIAGLHFFFYWKKETKHKKTQHVHRTAIQPPLRRQHPVVDHGRRVAGFIHRRGEHRDPNRTFFFLFSFFLSLSIIFFPTFFFFRARADSFSSSFFFLLSSSLSLER
jgi:hypothetical protein